MLQLQPLLSRLIGMFILCFFAYHSLAQVDIVVEGFETDGEISRYVSDDSFNDGGCNFFNRTNSSNAGGCYPGALTNLQGSWFWASEDIDEPTNPNLTFSTLTLNAANVTGYTSLEVRVFMAVGQPGLANAVWEQNDFVRIQYQMNGGGYQTIGQFVGDMPFGGDLRQDTNLDGVADGGAPVITTSFTEYTFSVPVTGTSMNVRIRLEGHAGTEEFAFDQIRIRGILAMNEAPVLANIEGTTLTFTEGGVPLQVTNTITVADVDDTNIESATVAIIAGFNSSEDVLAASPPMGITASYNSMSGILTLMGSSSLANYQTALRSVTYDNTDNVNPTTTTRTVRFQVNDGTSGSNFQSRNISITAVVNAPAALPYCESFETDGEGTRYTSNTYNQQPGNCDYFYRTNATPGCFSEAVTGANGTWYWASEDVNTGAPGTGFVVLSPLIATGLADFDIDVLLGVTSQSVWETTDSIRIQYNMDGGMWITVGAFYGAGDGLMRRDADLNGIADPAGTALTNVMQNFNFPFNTSGTNLNVRILVGQVGGTEELAFDNICVTGMAAQAAPVLANIEMTPLNYTEDDPATQITNTITVMDPDDTMMDSARIWFCAGYVNGEDVLAYTALGGISGMFNPATGVLALTGTSSIANYQTVLRSITYQNTNTVNPANHQRQVCFRINDGTINSNVVSRFINVIEVLDNAGCLPIMESFESDGEGVRYHSNTFEDILNCDFFIRTNTQPSCHTDPVTGINGSWFWASEDVVSMASANLPGTITLAPMTVTDFTAIQASILFGVSANAGGNIWETTDNILVQYNMDGGGWTTFGLLQGDNAIGGNLRVDTDNNPGTAGPYGATVPNGSTTDLAFSIPATGDLLEVRIVVQQDGGTEELVFDNIRITGTYVGMNGAVCNDITVYLPEGDYTFPPADSAAIVAGTDACGDYTVLFDPEFLTCNDVGTTPVDVYFTNMAGDTVDQCVSNVTLFDTIPPLAFCEDITVHLNGSGVASISVTDIDGGSTDLCDIMQSEIDINAVDCDDVGLNPVIVTLTVTDNNGNTATCTSEVTVLDTIRPTIICPGDQIAYLDVSCDVVLPDFTGNVTADDNCPGEMVVQSPAAGTTFSSHGVEVITMTVTDASGNTASCTFNFSVQDTVAPIAVCQDVTLYLDAMGTATLAASQVNNGSSDNCGIESMSTNETIYTCFNVGNEVIIFTVSDFAGNTATCTATITALDTIAPTAICQDVTINLDANGMASTTAAAVNNGSSDACGIASLSLSQTSFDCSEVGSNSVTLTVTDVNGNTSTCTANVLVVDNIFPTITCPANDTVYANENCEVTLADYTSLATADDNCPGFNVVQSPIAGTVLSGHGTVQGVTLTVTDASGNTNSCAFNVTIQDTTAPVVVCMDITIQLDEQGLATISSGDIDNGSMDNCAIIGMQVSQTEFTCDDFGDNTVTLTVTDIAGNTSICTANVHVEDPFVVCCDLPVAICQDVTVNLDEDGNASIEVEDVDNGSTADCGLDSIYLNILDFDCDDVGNIIVTMTVIDSNGNMAACTSNVTVLDLIPPTITCPENAIIECGVTEIPVPDPQSINANDNCGIESVTWEGDVSEGICPEIITRTYLATDVNGNTAVCTQIFTIVDTTPPSISCPEDDVIDCDEMTCLTFDESSVNPLGAPVIVTSVTEGDVTVDIRAYRKGGIQVSAALFDSDQPVTEPDLGTPNVLYGGTGVSEMDPDGYNTSNNQSLGNLLIIQNPLVNYPDDHILGDSMVLDFNRSVYVSGISLVDFEIEQVNSGAGVYMYNQDGSLLGFVGLNAAEGGDNSVQDLYLNTFGVRKLVVYYGSAVPSSGAIGNLCYTLVPFDAVITDLCQYQGEVVEETAEVGECSTIVRHAYLAVDECGNTSSRTCVITLLGDYLQPDVICPDDMTIGCEDPLPAPDASQVVATDNCSSGQGIFLTWVEDISEGQECAEVTRRIYSATDECGNESLCVQIITREELPPSVGQIQLNAKVMLGGPMEPGAPEMHPMITELLPLQQPYSGAPFYYGGTESVTEFGDYIVDWVLVELRDIISMEVISRRAALVTETGDIVDLDGTSPLTFTATSDFYYVAMCHRNHLDVLSDGPVDFMDQTGVLDLTLGNAGMIEVSPGMWAMIKGDTNKDGLINNTDLVILAPPAAIGYSGQYLHLDVNMDGLVNNTDLVLLAPFAAIGFTQGF